MSSLPCSLFGWLICIFVTSIIIGLPCWLTGCNPNVKGGCLTKDIISGNLTEIHISEYVCRKCTHYCNNGKNCCAWKTYDCWEVVLSFQEILDSDSENPGDVCQQRFGRFPELQTAENIASDYSLYQKYIRAIDRNTEICTGPKFSLSTWIAGIFFLSLAGLTVLIAFISGFYIMIQIVILKNDFTIN